MTITTRKIILLFSTFFLSCVLTACSDEAEKNKSAITSSHANSSSNTAKTPISHTLANAKVDNNEKQKFEQAFADQCVQRELRHSSDPNNDQPRFEKACTCIATYMMKDLTAIEAEKFLVEHENVQSLRIKYDYASYHCLQEKVPHQDPTFTHNQ